MNLIATSYKYKNALLFLGVGLMLGGILFFKRKSIMEWLDSQHNQAYINSLNEAAKPYFKELFDGIRKLGYEPYVTSAYRDYDKTIELKAVNSKNATISYHNFGVALDLNIKKDGVIILGKASSVEAWEKTGIPQLAKKLGFIWGGTDIPNYFDPVHFDLRKLWDIVLLQDLGKKQFATTSIKTIMDSGNKIDLKKA